MVLGLTFCWELERIERHLYFVHSIGAGYMRCKNCSWFWNLLNCLKSPNANELHTAVLRKVGSIYFVDTDIHHFESMASPTENYKELPLVIMIWNWNQLHLPLQLIHYHTILHWYYFLQHLVILYLEIVSYWTSNKLTVYSANLVEYFGSETQSMN